MKRAFTLIELLVVIAVIAVLAALLFPVFARVRERGQVSACLSNLRQLGAAFQMYARDADVSESEWPAGDWIERVQPYVRSSGIFTCPSNTWSQAWADWVSIGATAPAVSFAWNYNSVRGGLNQISGGGARPDAGMVQSSYAFADPGHFGGYGATDDLFRTAAERNPSDAILLGETRLPSWLATYVTPGYATTAASFQLTPPVAPPIQGNGGLIQTHNGRSNWLFHDGHARSLTVAQTCSPHNLWSTLPIDQPDYDLQVSLLASEYR